MGSQKNGSPPLAPNIVASDVDGGRIVENILLFARLLRVSGMAVGPGQVIRGNEAVIAAGLKSPKTLYWALHAVFVKRRSEREIFNQAFLLFWKDPGYLRQLLSVMLPTSKGGQDEKGRNRLSRRVNEALMAPGSRTTDNLLDELTFESEQTWSDRELLRRKDFEEMSAAELRQAKDAIRRMSLLSGEIPVRRLAPSPRGERLDVRAIMRDMSAKGPDCLMARYRRSRKRRPPLVVLCDISGSMERYARVFLHFLYAVTNEHDRVHAFLFGTRLTNVTRQLRGRDADRAISLVAGDVEDWSGGTRIGCCLKSFNRHWARRVLGQNATVLLFTDGLDREAGEGLERSARRLRTSCRRLVWVNPLLRFEGYEPIAAGARVLTRHASELRSCHNLASLEALVAALGPRRRGR